MKVTLIGGRPESLEVEEKDGKYVGEDGTVYELAHTSSIYTFVTKVEEAIDAAEDAIESVEDKVAGELEVTEASEETEAPAEEPAEDDDPGQAEGDAA